jgi:hypothetical protein
MSLRPPAPAELRSGPRTWAHIAAVFLLIGGLLFLVGGGLVLRVFGLFVLAQGAKALWVGVELQFGTDPTRKWLVGRLLLTVLILVTLGVARLTGTWH